MSRQVLKNSIWVVLFGSQSVMAGPPVAYDEWSVTNGAIDTSASCSNAGVSCRTLAADNGFVYEEVNTPVYSFLRMILTDKDATGTPATVSFSSEIYNPYASIDSGIAQGVAGKQVVRDALDNFALTAEVQKSNMRGLNATSAEEMYTTRIDQSLSNTEISGDFSYTNYTNFATGPSTSPDTNVERGRVLDISQSVLIGEAGDVGTKQVFEQRQRKGSAGNGTSFGSFLPPGLPSEFTVGGSYFVSSPITTAGSATLPVTKNGQDTGTTASISWLNGNDIATTWIAQSSNVQAGTAGAAFQRVTNKSNGSEASALLIDIPEPTDPFAWNANFGVAP